MVIFHKFNKYRNNLIWGGYVRFCRMLWSYEIVAYDLVNMRKIKNKYKIYHIISSYHWCETNKYRSLEAIRCLSLRRWIYLDPLDVGSIFLYGLPTVVKNGNYTFSGFDLNHWRFGRKWVGRFLVKMSSRRDFGRFESIIFGRRFSLAKKLNTF